MYDTAHRDIYPYDTQGYIVIFCVCDRRSPDDTATCGKLQNV